jgi:hypothetical protein
MDKPKAAKGCGGVRKQTMLWIVQAAGVRKESGRLTDRPTVHPTTHPATHITTATIKTAVGL